MKSSNGGLTQCLPRGAVPLECLLPQLPLLQNLVDDSVELQDIVDAINAVGGTPSSLIAILEALKRSGSLKAELIVI